jgi:hypothetical protein
VSRPRFEPRELLWTALLGTRVLGKLLKFIIKSINLLTVYYRVLNCENHYDASSWVEMWRSNAAPVHASFIWTAGLNLIKLRFINSFVLIYVTLAAHERGTASFTRLIRDPRNSYIWNVFIACSKAHAKCMVLKLKRKDPQEFNSWTFD